MPEIDGNMVELTHRATLLAPQRPWLQAVSDLRVAAGNPKGSNYVALRQVLQPYLGRPHDAIGGSTETFLRIVLYVLARDFIEGAAAPGLQLPSSIRDLLDAQVRRIERESADENVDHFRVDDDFFLKDLALVTGCLLPVGAELVQPHSGIPRSILWQGNIRQFLAGTSYFLAQRRGFVGYCALHLDNRQLQHFNPEGWRQTYLRIAELLELNPAITGVFGSAWFYDPVVADISPHLAYLRTVREAGGARNFRGDSASYVTNAAVAKSRRRAALYREGKYHPTAYYLVWHRRELLRWARMHTNRSS
jgi:hypothetical protein